MARPERKISGAAFSRRLRASRPRTTAAIRGPKQEANHPPRCANHSLGESHSLRALAPLRPFRSERNDWLARGSSLPVELYYLRAPALDVCGAGARPLTIELSGATHFPELSRYCELASEACTVPNVQNFDSPTIIASCAIWPELMTQRPHFAGEVLWPTALSEELRCYDFDDAAAASFDQIVPRRPTPRSLTPSTAPVDRRPRQCEG
jgi:hypothetical protein